MRGLPINFRESMFDIVLRYRLESNSPADQIHIRK